MFILTKYVKFNKCYKPVVIKMYNIMQKHGNLIVDKPSPSFEQPVFSP